MTGDALRSMLGRYSLVTAEDAENALRPFSSDVAPFLKNPEDLSSVWSNELFARLGEAFLFHPGNAGSV